MLKKTKNICGNYKANFFLLDTKQAESLRNPLILAALNFSQANSVGSRALETVRILVKHGGQKSSGDGLDLSMEIIENLNELLKKIHINTTSKIHSPEFEMVKYIILHCSNNFSVIFLFVGTGCFSIIKCFN